MSTNLDVRFSDKAEVATKNVAKGIAGFFFPALVCATGFVPAVAPAFAIALVTAFFASCLTHAATEAVKTMAGICTEYLEHVAENALADSKSVDFKLTDSTEDNNTKIDFSGIVTEVNQDFQEDFQAAAPAA